MEELQSTEILDREILEDARKKAMRILKQADAAVSAQNGEWEKKTREALSGLQKKFDEQYEAATVKIMARLPIDKHRLKIEKIENLLNAAVESWYRGLNREKILKLLENELKRQIDICRDISFSTPFTAHYSGLEKTEAEKILKNFSGINSVNEEPNSGKNQYPTIILVTENIRITSSIKKIIDSILEDKREELIESLAGRAYMEEL